MSANMNITTEKLVHDAIACNLLLGSIQTPEVRPANELSTRTDAVIGAMKCCLQNHAEMVKSFDADFSSVGSDYVLRIAFNMSDLAEKMREGLDKTWEIAPRLTVRRGEYCTLATELEKAWAWVEDTAETWRIAANPNLKSQILQSVIEADRESNQRGEISNWRDSLAAL